MNERQSDSMRFKRELDEHITKSDDVAALSPKEPAMSEEKLKAARDLLHGALTCPCTWCGECIDKVHAALQKVAAALAANPPELSHLPDELEPMPLPPLAKAGETSGELREQVAKAIHRKNDLCHREGPDETWESGYECACFEMADAAIAASRAASGGQRIVTAKMVAQSIVDSEDFKTQAAALNRLLDEAAPAAAPELSAVVKVFNATVELWIGTVVVRSWLGTKHEPYALQLAAELNALLKPASTRIGE